MVAMLTETMEELYQRTGRATGYWAHYFLREVRKRGGLVTAKNLLRPERGVSKGFKQLIEAQRADLSVEALVLRKEFSDLFSQQELDEAKRRLEGLPATAFPSRPDIDEVFPEEVPETEHPEGAVCRITVNKYERDRRTRAKCIRHHGARCIVCGLDFEDRYGKIGKGFIHVHHLRPLSLSPENYIPDPKRDLVPVCPNCHAMLHTHQPPLDPEDLRRRLRPASQDGGTRAHASQLR